MTLEALMREAAAAFSAGDTGRAEPLFRQIVGLNPRDAQAWHALALIGCESGRPNDAFDCALRAHKLDTRNPLFLNMVGVSCAESGREEEALRWFRRALKERPDDAHTHYNLAKALGKLRQHDAAEKAYRSALQIDPSNSDAANNLAHLCMRNGRFDEAQRLLERASALLPEDETVAINAALVLLALQGPPAAISRLEGFLARHPDAAHVHYELSMRLLAEGRFAEGWREYAWRYKIPDSAPPPGLAQHLPADLSGRSVLLMPIQGLGDQIFFLRFVPMLRRRGATVIFACPDKMLGMLAGAPELDGIVELDSADRPELTEAILVSVADLPRLLETDATPSPFRIAVTEERRAAWAERLAALGPPPYVGLTWRAGTAKELKSGFAPASLVALYKEIDIAVLAQAVGEPPGTLLALQRLLAPGEIATLSRAAGRKVHDLSGLNERLEDMAAVLSLIEEYVGVSNTNMHIRAGVGKAARVLVPYPPEYRWVHSGQTSPWFPGFRVYRQPASLDWTQALHELASDLARLSARR
ncbi:MAG TPA: tetratricopeptide repeat protein [Burkholderiales bacterium]|jgi:Flp pilus assembly protein TadD|nr:tetratricopeptide repeat protein [Burkholderiales bacterium]